MSLKRKNTGKTPGPDNCPAEFFQWLNHGNRHILLECFNDILDRDIYPESFKLANIVSIYKKGDATQMKNYRPIALLQTLYKFLQDLSKTAFYKHMIHGYKEVNSVSDQRNPQLRPSFLPDA